MTMGGVRRLLWFCCVAVALLGLPGDLALVAHAGQPTTHPILRIETGMHTSLIRRLVADQPHDRLITCSDDKTIRVWQLPRIRLLSTFRVPIDAGHEGQLFAIAVSPDGNTIAAGGWTGWDWDHKASIYFFDVASGELIRRRGGFDDGINTLAWSHDGKYLVVGLQGRSGLQLLRLSDLAIVARDAQYNDKVMELDVRRDGAIAATAMDGIVRLYDPSLKIIVRRALTDSGKQAASVRFSPDGSLLAVGFLDTPTLSVLDSRDLSVRFRPATGVASSQKNLSSVAWSSDGDYLYAGGDSAGPGLNPLYRWSNGGWGKAEAIPLAKNRIAEIRQMGGGAIAFAAEDPGIGVVAADGKRMAFRGSEIIDFSHARGQLELSADGTEIAYPIEGHKDPRQTFSALRSGDQDLTRRPSQPMWPPITHSDAITVKNWEDSYSPTINGIRPKLDDYEISRSYAIAPDRNTVLLGTEWALRLFDKDAKPIWTTRLSSVVRAVNISRGGALAVAALSDGTIRWYRMRDGAEILAFFPHNNGTDWISWVPSGYYVSSVIGDNLIGWHLNRGRDLTPDFYRAVQFDRILYRPDIVAEKLTGTIGISSRGKPPQAAKPEAGISRLSEIAPPRLRMTLVRVKIDANGHARAVLDVRAEKTRLDMRDISLYVNNVPATPFKDRKLVGEETGHLEKRFEIPLSNLDNQIRVEAFNGVSIGIAESTVSLPPSTTLSNEPGNLYLLAIGANAFSNLPEDNWLKFAANDAEELTRVLTEKANGLFKRIVAKTLTDDTPVKPDRSAIINALEFLQQAGPEDTVIVFLASHGVSDRAGNYYFVPRDAKPEDFSAIDAGREPSSLVPWNLFFDALRATAGRRLLIVDTCHARGIEGQADIHSIMKRSAGALYSIMVAAKSDESSQEYSAGHHGVFTFSLIHSLDANSDTNKDGVVTVEEVFDAISSMVPNLRNKRIPQTPQLVVPPPKNAFPLIRVAAGPPAPG
jgi:WD40 repeat protein